MQGSDTLATTELALFVISTWKESVAKAKATVTVGLIPDAAAKSCRRSGEDDGARQEKHLYAPEDKAGKLHSFASLIEGGPAYLSVNGSAGDTALQVPSEDCKSIQAMRTKFCEQFLAVSREPKLLLLKQMFVLSCYGNISTVT